MHHHHTEVGVGELGGNLTWGENRGKLCPARPTHARRANIPSLLCRHRPRHQIRRFHWVVVTAQGGACAKGAVSRLPILDLFTTPREVWGAKLFPHQIHRTHPPTKGLPSQTTPQKMSPEHSFLRSTSSQKYTGMAPRICLLVCMRCFTLPTGVVLTMAPMPALACFTRSRSQDSEPWRLLTTTDVSNVPQGQEVPDH